MRFTEFKFDQEHINDVVQRKREGLMKNRGISDLLGFGLSVVSKRLNNDPRRYLDYGPYWWALKTLLRNAGYPVGDVTDPLVEAEYCGAESVQTLICADEFREIYLKTQVLGSNKYLLQLTNPEYYVLFDNDMELQIGQ